VCVSTKKQRLMFVKIYIYYIILIILLKFRIFCVLAFIIFKFSC